MYYFKVPVNKQKDSRDPSKCRMLKEGVSNDFLTQLKT